MHEPYLVAGWEIHSLHEKGSFLAVLTVGTSTSASCRENITRDGGAPVTTRGVCGSTTQNPAIANSIRSDGTGAGSFVRFIIALTPGTILR